MVSEVMAQLTPAAFTLALTAPQSALAKDVEVLMSRADPLAHRLALLAQQYPSVYKAIKQALKYGAIGGLIGEVFMIGLAIAGNHGVNIKLPGFSQTIQNGMAARAAS